MSPAQSLSWKRQLSKMSDADLRLGKIVEVLDDLVARQAILEVRVQALVSLIEFVVDNLPGDPEDVLDEPEV